MQETLNKVSVLHFQKLHVPEPFLKGSTANTMHPVVVLQQREGRKGNFSNLGGEKTSNTSSKDSMLQKKNLPCSLACTCTPKPLTREGGAKKGEESLRARDNVRPVPYSGSAHGISELSLDTEDPLSSPKSLCNRTNFCTKSS